MAATVTDLLDNYRRYLVTMDEWSPSWDGDHSDMLSPGEVFDLFWIRDRLQEAKLSKAGRRELSQLDDLLLKYCEVIVANMPPRAQVPRTHWWWYLDEGPSAREKARGVA